SLACNYHSLAEYRAREPRRPEPHPDPHTRLSPHPKLTSPFPRRTTFSRARRRPSPGAFRARTTSHPNTRRRVAHGANDVRVRVDRGETARVAGVGIGLRVVRGRGGGGVFREPGDPTPGGGGSRNAPPPPRP